MSALGRTTEERENIQFLPRKETGDARPFFRPAGIPMPTTRDANTDKGQPYFRRSGSHVPTSRNMNTEGPPFFRPTVSYIPTTRNLNSGAKANQVETARRNSTPSLSARGAAVTAEIPKKLQKVDASARTYAATVPNIRKAAISSTQGTLGGSPLSGATNSPTSPEQDTLDRTWVPYECSCCINDVPFEYMVQCNDGHLFCIECLQKYVQEAVFGGGMGTLKCLDGECQETFPESQLKRALPDKMKAKLEERIQEEEINGANLKNFTRCFYCNCGAELMDENSFFHCPNKNCGKVSCVKCHVEYSEHQGLSCKDIEKSDETKVRKEFEEKMAAAKIRECPKCQAKFTKEEGCNKIVCRCGSKMCYICRQTIRDYSHFCQHVRTPGKACKRCNRCKVYTNSEQDDNLAIEEFKKAAQESRKLLGFSEEKEVGAPMQ